MYIYMYICTYNMYIYISLLWKRFTAKYKIIDISQKPDVINKTYSSPVCFKLLGWVETVVKHLLQEEVGSSPSLTQWCNRVALRLPPEDSGLAPMTDVHTESTPYDLAPVYSCTASDTMKQRVWETVGDLASSMLAYLLYNCHSVKEKKKSIAFLPFKTAFFS